MTVEETAEAKRTCLRILLDMAKFHNIELVFESSPCGGIKIYTVDLFDRIITYRATIYINKKTVRYESSSIKRIVVKYCGSGFKCLYRLIHGETMTQYEPRK
jgi:hypothetical protein